MTGACGTVIFPEYALAELGANSEVQVSGTGLTFPASYPVT